MFVRFDNTIVNLNDITCIKPGGSPGDMFLDFLRGNHTVETYVCKSPKEMLDAIEVGIISGFGMVDLNNEIGDIE